MSQCRSRESNFTHVFVVSFPFCTIAGESSPVENLGQVLFGERIRPSPYKVSDVLLLIGIQSSIFSVLFQFNFLEEKTCEVACTKKLSVSSPLEQKLLKRLMKGMVLNYQQHWILDNMPVTLCYTNAEGQEFCSRGFPIGCYVTKSGQSKESCNIRDGKNDTFYLFNHLDFEIFYHSGKGQWMEEKSRLVTSTMAFFISDETWGSAFGEDGGRIVAAKVQINRSVQSA